MASYLDKSGLTTLWSKIKNSFLPLGGGTITGTLDISNADFGPLSVTRSGSSNFAGIKFVNSEGTLGSIGMTAVDDALYRLPADGSNAYKILDGSNWSSYAMAARPASIELYPSSSAGYGGYIDFHYNGSSTDHTSRIIEQASGELAINGIAINGSQITGSLNGNAASATKLANARSVQTNLASTSAASFNGTAAITPGVTGILGIGNGGTGASSAASAREKLHAARRDSVAQSAINDIDETGLYTQTSDAGLLIHLRWDGNYSAQIRNSHGHNTFNYRVKVTSSAGWQSWRRFLWAPEGTAVGNGNTPVYINTDGTPVACGELTAAILKSSATPTYGLNGLQYFNASLSTSDTTDGTISYAPTADWWYILRMNHGNGNGYYIDIGACFHQDYLAYRRVASGTDSGWFRILDEKSGLMKSGDTMTGELALLGNRYTYGTDGKCGLNANNSDIAKVNAIYFADASDSIGEGINFWRTESTWDNMTASHGTFYFGSNVSANATLVGNAYLRAAQYTATDANGFRHAYGDTGYGVFTRNDASHFYLMLTNEGDPLGSWNSLRPLAIKLSDGSISFGTACTFGSSLTASTVSIWNSSHAPLTIGRSGSTYYASIKFANSLGTLGYLGMTAVDGALCKGNSTASDFYALLDASNWSTYCMSKNPAYIEFSPSSTGNYGGYLDFHYNNSSADYTSRIIEDASGQLTINGVHFKSSQIIAGSYAVPRVKAWDGSTLTLVP